MATLVNLTDHALNFYDASDVQPHPTKKGVIIPRNNANPVLIVQSAGETARLATVKTARTALTVDGVEIITSTTEFGEVEGLPEPREGVVYIVSGLILSRYENRVDLAAPGAAVRDAEGNIIGCVGLSVTPAAK